MKYIENQTFPHERDLYAADGVHLLSCAFDGEEDGESALKHAKNITAEKCFFNLRYPLWHCEDVRLRECVMTDKCRAALWYTRRGVIENCELGGIKALRECDEIEISASDIVSPEFGWRCRGVGMRDCRVESEYLFLGADGVSWSGVGFKGKYSFQYARGVEISNCTLDTKDAFWHAENVTVRDSVINGEYLGWYSDGLTLINCRINGTQPLCCCTNLKLINCEMTGADLAFEYSDVEADLRGNLVSVKNPRGGRITADRIGEIILTEDSVYPPLCEIAQRKA
ncbi:MAG: DUF3737 family protein [Clostridia bacterium]|nr:DUF3737 family protein [Clostridia bacterium]